MDTNFKKLAVISSILLTVLLVSSCTWAEEKKEMMEDKETSVHSVDMDNKMEEMMEEKIEEMVNEMEEKVEEKMEEIKEEMVETESKYKDLAEFISTTLTEEQDKAILEILDQRTSRQAEIKAMLMTAVQEWDIEEKLEEVKAMRKVCAGRILPFVADDKKEAFTIHCENGNESLKEKFMNMDK